MNIWRRCSVIPVPLIRQGLYINAGSVSVDEAPNQSGNFEIQPQVKIRRKNK